MVLNETERVRKELASQILILLDYQQKFLTGQLITLVNYAVWKKNVKPFGLEVLWRKKS